MGYKGVILAAGYGTRLLPVTRVVPKELLPIVDRPAIDLVVQELVDAGVTDLLVIGSRRKTTLDDWFDRDPELEAACADSPDKLARLAPPGVRTTFVRQPRMAGTGAALMLARTFAGSDPIVVAYPDDLFGEPNCTAQLLEVHRATGGSVLAASDGAHLDLSRYGVLDVELGERWPRLHRIVEKPAPGTEPSTLVSWGRFVFTPDLFDALEASHQGHAGGEFFHVGAIDALAARGRVHVRVIDAPRWDTGTAQGYVQTVIEAALARPEMGPALRTWLRERLERDDG
jgi:UTP--glucose-1-phosphate uridylyltransferase